MSKKCKTCKVWNDKLMKCVPKYPSQSEDKIKGRSHKVGKNVGGKKYKKGNLPRPTVWWSSQSGEPKPKKTQ